MAGQNFKIGVDDQEAQVAFEKLAKSASSIDSIMESLGITIDGVFDSTGIDKYLSNMDDAKSALSQLVALEKTMAGVYTSMVQGQHMSGLFSTEEVENMKDKYMAVSKAVSEADKAVKMFTKQDELKLAGLDVAIDKVSELERKYKDTSRAVSMYIDDIERASSRVVMSKDNSLESQLESWVNFVNTLEQTIPKLEKYTSELSGMSVDVDNKDLVNANMILDDYGKNIKFAKERVSELSSTIGVSVNSAKKFSTQLRAIKDEMTALTLSGDTESERYKELEKELERIGTAYRKVGEEQKLLTKSGSAMVAGLSQGLQAVAGTFTLIQGVSSAISGDSKDVAEVQRKLQQAMAITMGMQQLSTALHSTSQLRIGLVARATDMLTTAQTRLSTALNISATSAKALMGALTLGVSVGIGLLISAYNKYSSKLEETRKRQEEVNQQYESQYSTVSRLIVKYNALRNQWIEIGNSLKDQNKFIKDNKESLNELGKEINNVKDADQFFIDNTESYIKALSLRAEANAHMALAEKEMANMLTTESKRKDRENTLSWLDKLQVKFKKLSISLDLWAGTGRYTEDSLIGIMADNMSKDLEQYDDVSKKSKEDADAHIKDMIKLAKESQDIFKQLGVDFDIKKPKKEKKDTKAEKEQKSLEAQYIKFEKEKLEIEKLGLKDRIKLIEIERKERRKHINDELNDFIMLKNKISKEDILSYRRLSENMKMFKGNVDLLSRPMIDAANLVKKGWEDAGDGIATVYSSQFGIEDSDGIVREILVTPILPNGDVLSPDELDSYIYDKLEGSKDILKDDELGIVISVDVDVDGMDGEYLHKMQEEFYKIASEMKVPLNIDEKEVFDKRLTLLDEFFNKKIQLEKDAITKENLEKLKEYQTLADRRLEIEKKYNDLIKIAEKEGQGQQVIDNIRKDMEKALSSFDFSALKSDLDLSYLFGDLSRISKSSIKSVIADLKKLRDANKNAWSIEELKIFNDKIKEAENLLATKSPFEVIKNSMTNISSISKNIEDKQREILELSNDELKNAEKLKKAKKELKELEDARASAIESTNKALNEIGQQGAEVISSLTNFMGTLEKFGVAFSDSMKESLSGLGQMFDAIASVDITKPASIVTGTINYVSGLGNLVAGLFSSSNDLTQAQVDSYNKYIKVVDDVINKQNELLRNTTGTSTMDLSDKIEKNIKAQIKETQDIASKYLSSKRGGRFSEGNWREAQANLKKYREEMKALGYDIDSVQKELIKLTPKELEHIRDNMHEMWAGFDDELSGWLDDIISFGDRLDQLERDRKEALTGVSFDSLKNSLNELAKQADLTFEDISKSFQDNMENAILRLVQDKYLQDELAKWYDDFADKMDDGTLSKSERQELEDKYKEIAEKSNAMYKELLETAGIILDDSGEIAKKASKGYQVTASQDSVDEVLGIARNMQMVGLNQEQELIKQTEILSTFGNGFISMQQELQGITSITLESMYYLRDIEKHTKTLNGFGEILTKIEKNTQ